MSQFTVFDVETGQALRGISASHADQIHIQTAAVGREVIIEGDFTDGNYRLVNGWPEYAPPPAKTVTSAEVDQHLFRLLDRTDWIFTRERETGQPPPADMLALRAAIRTAAKQIEAMDPIPTNFRDPAFWPEQDDQ